MIPRERLIDTAPQVYRSYGFSPIDTPALEYCEILLGKGGDETDKQLYRFQDHGGREVGMRFDLTVPLGPVRRPAHRRAGHAVQALPHRHRLARREHAARPLPRIHAVRLRHDRHPLARRRYRNGAGHPRLAACAIGFEAFTIRVNNRLVLNGLLERSSAWPTRATAMPAGARQASARSAPRRSPTENGRRRGRHAEQADEVLKLAELIRQQTTRSFASSSRSSPATRQGKAGVDRLRRNACGRARPAGVPEERLQARRLDRPRPRLLHRHDLRNVPGRPADDRQRLLRRPLRQPGGPVHQAGAARHRRLARASTGCWPRWKSWACSPKVRHARPKCFIPYFDAERLDDYLRLAATLRAAGLGVEVYPEPRSSASNSNTPTAAAFASP